jgi:hypothetical protein
VVVEPDFRSLFSLRAASPAFDQLLALLPEAFVGSYSKLRAVVQLASQMVASACREAGQEVPPWRSRAALLSRWQRQGSHATPVGQPAAAGTKAFGAAPAAVPGAQAAEPGAGSRLVRAHLEGRPRPASPGVRRAAALAAFPAAKVARGFDASPASSSAPPAMPVAGALGAAVKEAEAVLAKAAAAPGKPWQVEAHPSRAAEPVQQADAVATFTLVRRAAGREAAAAAAGAAAKPGMEAAARPAGRSAPLREWLSPVPGGKLPALGAAKQQQQQQHGTSARGWPAGMDQPWAGQLPRVFKVWLSQPGRGG